MSFEQNTIETIEKITRNLETMTHSILDLYGKLDELNNSIEKITKIIAVEEVEEGMCPYCKGTGNLASPGRYLRCHVCNGTGLS